MESCREVRRGMEHLITKTLFTPDAERPELSWLKKQFEQFAEKEGIAGRKMTDTRLYERLYGQLPEKQTDTLKIRYWRTGRHRQVCPLCFFMLGIFPNGDVYPCETIYRPEYLGNVGEDRLVELWKSEKLRRFWRMQLEGRRGENPHCAQCCAPDDVSHPEDELDGAAEILLERLEKAWRK